jgi:chromosome segregation ATPase
MELEMLFPSEFDDELFLMLTEGVRKIKANIHQLEKTQSVIEDRRGKLESNINFYKSTISSLKEKKDSYAEVFATVDKLRDDMVEQFRLIGQKVPPHLLAYLDAKKERLVAKAEDGPSEIDRLIYHYFVEQKRCESHLRNFSVTAAMHQEIYLEQKAFLASHLSKLDRLNPQLTFHHLKRQKRNEGAEGPEKEQEAQAPSSPSY